MRSTFCVASALFIAIMIVCFGTPRSFAQTQAPQTVSPSDVPRTMSYQGYLTGPNGHALSDGQYAITVKLYTDPEGVRSIYEATYQATIVNGIFNILLGTGATPLPSTEKMNAPLWIGITVNGHEELKPYTPLSASPYALNVPNNAITSDKLQDGAVTARKLGTDYIGSLWLDGDQITGKGGKINLVGQNGIDLQFDLATNTLVFRGSGGFSAGPSEIGNSAVPRTLTDLIVNGNVDLGGTSANAQIKFRGRAATGLDMNSNSLTEVGELSLGHARSYSGFISLFSEEGVGRAQIESKPQLVDHTYMVPDAGSNADFILSEGAQTIGGTKAFTEPIVGSLAGNALTATTAGSAQSADQISNSWAAGASIVAALMTNGGTISNSTTGNAKTASLATSALSAHSADEALRIANTADAGASITRALQSYAKPLPFDITGNAATAQRSLEAFHATNADHAVELQNTWAAGFSAANALKAWNGTLSNNTTGNAATVTNGLYSTGRYLDPTWLGTLSGSKITGRVDSAAFAANADHASYTDHATSATTADKAIVATTVMNGVYTTSSYSDPAWLTSLSASKLKGAVQYASFAESAKTASPIGTASGDLSGSFPSPQVIRVGLQAGNSVVEAINHSTGTINALSVAKDLTIFDGSINATPIGRSLPASGAFTTSQSTLSLGANSAPQVGTRYADNNIVAWGDISSTGAIVSQFGGMTVQHPATGRYIITLPVIPRAAAIQVTSENVDPIMFSAVRKGNVITVRAYGLASQSPVSPIDGAFYITVVTRP